MKRRTLLGAGLLGAVSAGAGACAPPSGGGSGDGSTLDVWGWNQKQEWTAGIEAFNDVQDDITVTYRGVKAEEYNAVLQTGLTGSQGPDVMMLRSYGGLETLVESGAVKPIDGRVDGLEEFSANALQGARARKDDKLYGVPFAIQTANVIYNKEIFAQLGLEVPATWEDFEALCQEVQDAGKTPLAAAYQEPSMTPIYRDMFGAAVYQGPQLVDELVSGAADFTDPRYTAANQVLADLRPWMPDAAQAMSIADMQTLFVSGRAAMYPGGIWELAPFTQYMDPDSLGLFLAPPVEGSTDYAMGYADGSWGVRAGISEEKQESAFALLNYFAGQEYGSHIADSVLQVPCVPGVEPRNQLVADARAWFEENPTPYITYVNFDYGTPSGTSLEYSNLQNMLLGQIEPVDVGIALDEGISQWYEPHQ